MMHFNPAQRLYAKRFLVLMLSYVAILLAVAWTFNRFHPSGPLAYLLGVLPALPVIGIFLSMGWYLIEETDEYLRLVEAQKSLIATGFMLTIATAWGFLQSFDLLPNVNFYWAAILWFAGLGFASCIQAARK
jgi:hypothetical protein